MLKGVQLSSDCLLPPSSEEALRAKGQGDNPAPAAHRGPGAQLPTSPAVIDANCYGAKAPFHGGAGGSLCCTWDHYTNNKLMILCTGLGVQRHRQYFGEPLKRFTGRLLTWWSKSPWEWRHRTYWRIKRAVPAGQKSREQTWGMWLREL